jgi:hypothetical protein
VGPLLGAGTILGLLDDCIAAPPSRYLRPVSLPAVLDA